MKTVIHTDGSCLNNPGPGGWSAIIRTGSDQVVISGGSVQTTNNRMELTAVIEALRASSGPVEIVSDSKYVIQGASEWMRGWKLRGWMKKGNRPISNRDLWESLDQEVAGRDVTWTWVRGHDGDPLNESADSLATSQARIHSGMSRPKWLDVDDDPFVRELNNP